MILPWILIVPFIGGVLALGGRARAWPRYAACAALALDTFLLVWLWGRLSAAGDSVRWIAEYTVPWIPQLGINFHLAMDGLSLLMALLTCGVGLAALVGFWGVERKNEGFFIFLFMAAISSLLGVFLAADLMLFFIFFEVMLLPAFALIAIWGNEDRRRAAIRFFIFTQAGGLLMLVSILGLYVSHYNATGGPSFAYADLLESAPESGFSMLFLCGFLIAFAVKLPIVPFHSWQPAAYASAPPEASILLSALMAKTAGYGLLRFAIPFFPAEAAKIAPYAMVFGVVTILYASWLAFAQDDLKRIIAYSSAAHLGFIVLGAFSMNDLGQRGALVQMISHGVSVTGLFLIAGVLEQRTGSRDLSKFGGLWRRAPGLGGVSLVFVLATLGLPGLGNFIGEFMILAGAFQAYPVIAAIGVGGAVLSAAYSLRVMQRVFYGPATGDPAQGDAPALVLVVSGLLITALVFIGIYPRPILDAARTAVTSAHVQKDLP
mgnify:CR=1 FL=1